MQRFRIAHLLTPAGWRSPAHVEVDDNGIITALDQGGEGGHAVDGLVVPGVPNLHSHAFQRALVGATENADPARPGDSFWTWRTRMYELARLIGPDELSVIAEMLYVEMLEAGMTAVGEFHYLHHDPDGARYAEPAETSLRLIAAARAAGISMTHLPVLYVHGGFHAPPAERQRRFVNDVEGFLGIVETCKEVAGDRVKVGVAPHSLRAVSKTDLEGLVAAVDPTMPIHIHVAEQTKEVEEAVTVLGARPVAWLVEQIGIDPRWCLIHATHVTSEEVDAVAKSGAVVGLCPTTEANLGDGLFPAEAYVKAGGAFGVGSDSHVTVDPAEELRLLEYGQRLLHRRRNLLFGPAGEDGLAHVGRFLLEAAASGGAEALGQPAGALEVGKRADFVVLDPSHPRLAGLAPDGAVDAWIFGSAKGAVAEVWVGGERLVEAGRHVRRGEVADRYRTLATRLFGKSRDTHLI